MPNPIEAQEMDQNLYDEEEFLSCQTRGVIPLAGTDWRGVDQGESCLRKQIWYRRIDRVLLMVRELPTSTSSRYTSLYTDNLATS